MCSASFRDLRVRTHDLRHESTVAAWLARNRERLAGYAGLLRLFGEAVRSRDVDRFGDLFVDEGRLARFVALAESLATGAPAPTQDMIHELCVSCAYLDGALRSEDERFELVSPRAAPDPPTASSVPSAPAAPAPRASRFPRSTCSFSRSIGQAIRTWTRSAWRRIWQGCA
jgi:hypothetical protein